jgi:hypothetical protein
MNEEAKVYEYKVPEGIMRQKTKDPEGMKV